MDNKEMFAIFPYLKTSGSVYVRGIQFHSSDNVDHLPSESRHHLETILKMFFLRDNLRIKQMSYTHIVMDGDTDRQKTFFQRLREAQTLISYFYSSPDRHGEPFLSFEHSNLYLFRQARVSRFLVSPEHGVENVGSEPLLSDDPNEANGYEGWINSNLCLWVVPGSRIYPVAPDIWLNIAQNMHIDLMRFTKERTWALRKVFESDHPILPDLESRLFTSLEWFNRSHAINMREDVALVHLAIALESLLSISQGEELSKRFKETIITLLGPVPRLDSWLDQFYIARSKIVHEGVWPHLGFYAADRAVIPEIRKGKGKQPALLYRPLTAYGRVIFRLCLNTILSGAMLAEETNLSSFFFHNKERLEKICATLSKASEKPEQRLRSVARDVLDLKEYWYFYGSGDHIAPSMVLKAGTLLIQTYLETSPDIPEDVRDLMNKLVKSQTEPNKKATTSDKTKKYQLRSRFDLLSHLNNSIIQWRGGRPSFDVQLYRSIELFNIVWAFIDYASVPEFSFWELHD